MEPSEAFGPATVLAGRLLRAHGGGPPVDDLAIDAQVASAAQAYDIQEHVLRGLGEAPGVPRFWKSGSASRNGPLLHAPLPSRGVRLSGSRLDDLGMRHRWIEAEVALRMGRDVTAEHARAVVAGDSPELVDAMTVAIEIVDSRWASARQALPLQKLADLLVHGALVLGDFVPFTARAWAAQECQVRVGGRDWRSFRGSLSIGDPLWVLPQWLRHVTRLGATVPAGTVVTTGTWCGLIEAQAGDEVSVDFPGIGAATAQL
jgi:2-keto-4-pentenoate hydratase